MMDKPLPNVYRPSKFGVPGSTKRRNSEDRLYRVGCECTDGLAVLIASAVGAVVIIAAIVGGVAGGLASHKHSSAAVSSSPPGGGGAGGGGGGGSPSAPTTGSAGCNSTSQWAFDDTGHANVTMGNRTFYIHAPANYDNNRAHAVVLSYHGYSMNETNQELITGLSQAGIWINNMGIIAVYPAGSWGPGKPYDGPQRAWQGAPYSQVCLPLLLGGLF